MHFYSCARPASFLLISFTENRNMLNACLGCPVLLCKFQFPRCKSLGNITDLLTSIAVTGLLQKGRWLTQQLCWYDPLSFSIVICPIAIA